MLGGGNVGAAAYPEDFYATLRASRNIDIAKKHPVFMDDLEMRCRSEILFADAQRLDDDSFCRAKIALKLGLRFHQLHIAWVERAGRLPHLVAPALEVRQVGRHKVCKGVPPFLIGSR